MAVNLIESIQKNLGYPALHKIDPNTQDVISEEKAFGHNALAQAAIPAILLGFNNCLQQEEGASALLEGDPHTNYLAIIFGNKKDQVISKVAAYAAISASSAEAEMEHISRETVRIIHESFPESNDFSGPKDLFVQQKHEILSYLPASLNIGEILNNNTIDDRTNKMEGPVSNFMHKMEELFDSPAAK